ncbi:hypothetical protein Misp01_56570 [Microtetraspora sp. NBRC 13810]|nr:hypothetical protein Misp01_56570 [Microtetraspora sp. NBRC 13810]
MVVDEEDEVAEADQGVRPVSRAAEGIRPAVHVAHDMNPHARHINRPVGQPAAGFRRSGAPG